MMPTKHLHVLLIEDNVGDADLIRHLLARQTHFSLIYLLSHVETIQMAAEKLCTERFDVILLDWNLPDSNGLATLDQLYGLVPQSPIIILTGISNDLLTFEFVQHGVQDFVLKNECTSHLLQRVIHYAIERKHIEEHLKQLATHDPLTGLPNRALLYDRLAQALQRSERDRAANSVSWRGAVMLLDLDHFKTINDSLGHDQGDTVLQLAANRLRACLREIDTVARFGGDEFVAVIEGILNRADCLCIAQKILQSLNEPLSVSETQVFIAASIGISIFPDDGKEIASLIKCADIAMYSAKGQRGQIRFYQDQ
jgi:diguanylate cyclase